MRFVHGGTLLLVLLTGCVSPEPARVPTSWQSLKVEADPGPDRVLFDIALIQRPIDDSFLQDEIWTGSDEMILSTEQREALEYNGLRVGLLVGSPSEKLVHLLQSERSCLERRGKSVPSGVTITQNLRESKESQEVVLRVGKGKELLNLERPRFALDLIPTLREEGLVRLRLVPRLETGEKAMSYKPVPEESKWSLELKRPTRLLQELACDLDLAPNQVLVIGPRQDRPESIGYQALIHAGENETTQRLVVIRHLRPKTSARRSGESPFESMSSPPLAFQASVSGPGSSSD